MGKYVLSSSPQELIFRLNRDIRFSSDKKPYNPAFRAHLSPWGKPFIPLGYYLCIRPGEQSFVAGGLYGSGWQEAANRVRDYIADHGNEFEKIVTGNAFTKYFTVLGEKLKRVPKGNDIDHPQAEYLKHKSWYAQSFIADKTVLTAERFYDIVIEKYRALKPFKDYLNKALECYQIPKR